MLKLYTENEDLASRMREKFNMEVEIADGENRLVNILPDGEEKTLLTTEESLERFAQYGYNRIIKLCPYHDSDECIGEKCQLYVIQGITGDCAHVWNAVLSFEKR